jgi:acylphosphatase
MDDYHAAMICKRSFVSGRVQGVFYRATCVRKAEELGLTGYARNLADGRVEVLACGDEAAIEAFVAWLWEGSPASKVTDVATERADPAEGQRTLRFTSA